jgi:hypothetical protein
MPIRGVRRCSLPAAASCDEIASIVAANGKSGCAGEFAVVFAVDMAQGMASVIESAGARGRQFSGLRRLNSFPFAANRELQLVY